MAMVGGYSSAHHLDKNMAMVGCVKIKNQDIASSEVFEDNSLFVELLHRQANLCGMRRVYIKSAHAKVRGARKK